MKKLSLLFAVIFIMVVLAGCGQTISNISKSIDMGQAAKKVTKNSTDLNAVSSDENIESIFTIMNYRGSEEENNRMKAAIKQGAEDGKALSELNKNLVTTKDLGAGYMLGYTFGCKAATSDEAKCETELNQKYLTIMTEEMQKQIPIQN
jgi:flagellar basal body-associated protein FliL